MQRAWQLSWSRRLPGGDAAGDRDGTATSACEPGGKPRRVSGYQLLDGHWASAAPYDATCSDGSPVRITVETDWPLPQQPANPIPRLAGIQRDIYAVPCVKVVESQLVMERIGD